MTRDVVAPVAREKALNTDAPSEDFLAFASMLDDQLLPWYTHSPRTPPEEEYGHRVDHQIWDLFLPMDDVNAIQRWLTALREVTIVLDRYRPGGIDAVILGTFDAPTGNHLGVSVRVGCDSRIHHEITDLAPPGRFPKRIPVTTFRTALDNFTEHQRWFTTFADKRGLVYYTEDVSYNPRPSSIPPHGMAAHFHVMLGCYVPGTEERHLCQELAEMARWAESLENPTITVMNNKWYTQRFGTADTPGVSLHVAGVMPGTGGLCANIYTSWDGDQLHAALRTLGVEDQVDPQFLTAAELRHAAT